ncbi:Neuraminidase [Macrophomina phaseolina MS6]|uniref:Neuraminidase n=1 Tax=Macrophomina phaseolina (strain MS6) TaxID=1126212 RepID=K2SSW0_MACPH|nr:Neuraminidase [Macrophomina phaseolina MS6]
MMAGGLQPWLRSLAVLTLAAGLDATPLHRRAGVVPSLSGDAAIMGPVGNSTYPRANFLSDGSIIGAFTAFDDNPSTGARESTITLARSADSGTSWTTIGTAARGPTATTDIDNPYVLQLPSGRLLVAYRNHDRVSADAWSYYRLTVSYSDSNGVDWEYLSTPAQDSDAVTGDWEPFLRMADDGTTLQLYYSRENSDADQDSLLRTSSDGGVTWSDPTTIGGAELTTARDGMLGVAKTAAGDLIAVFETETGGGSFHIEAVTSKDDGATWEDRRVVYQPDDSAKGAAAPQVANVGGTLVVSFQTNEDGGDYAGKLVTSGDDGQTWDNKITFMPALGQWAGLLALDDSSFLAMAANDGTAKAQKVVLS